MPSGSTYRVKLFQSKIQFSCPDCGTILLPCGYESHCSRAHGINSKLTCVWCRKLSWPSGQKHKHYSHLKTCFENFIRKSTSVSSNEEYRLLNFNHACRQKTMYGGFTEFPTDEEYDSVWPLIDEEDRFWPSDIPIAIPPIHFRDRNLNLGGIVVCTYSLCGDRYEWHHIMVKAVVFPSFLRALDEDWGTLRIIPFSCWCNGGKYAVAKYRQHRHMICVSPKGYFDDVFWPKVKIYRFEDKPFPNFPCKRKKKIDSAMHLVNAMGYLSHRRSKCDFSFAELTTPYKLHHFYVYRTLPRHYKLPLVLLFEGGLEEYLYQAKYQNISIPRAIQNPMELCADGKYRQKNKHAYNHERGLIVPVSKEFVPDPNQVTTHFFYLMNGKKLYFTKCPENESMDEDVWLQKQIEGGNSFYENVGEEFWTPRERDQKILNYHKPVVDEVKILTDQVQDLDKKLVHTKRKLETAKKEIKDLKRDNESKQKEIDEMTKVFMREKITRLEREIGQLKEIIQHQNLIIQRLGGQ